MTKRTTKFVTALTLAVLVFAGLNCFALTGVLVNAAGSTGAFNAFALAADNATSECGTHIWTKKSGASGIDNRNPSIPANTANIWIVWNTKQNTVCSYLAVDSVIGQQLFFAVPHSTLSIPSAEIGVAGDNLVATLTDEPLPAAIYALLNGQQFNAAPSDIRPEDALFEANRVLAPLDTVHYNGLGYGPGPIGTTIKSSQSAKAVTPVAYAITGNDPISQLPVAAYKTTNVGAQAIIFFVNTTDSSAGGFGTSAFSNVSRFTLAAMLNGTFTRTRDMANQTGLPSIGAHVFLREPTSGTYTTTEFTIPRSVEINSTQELGVDPSVDNPLNISYASGGTRQRVVGSGEMVATVGATTDSLGYAFWSTTSFANVVGTTKYLTVDGVDPLYATVLQNPSQTFPTCTAPCSGLVTFPNIANGSYPAWNVLRVVTVNPAPSAVTKLITQAQSQVVNVTPDFLPLGSLQVFRSHYLQSGVSPANGLTGGSEAGGDVGGAVFSIQGGQDYNADTGHGLTNKKQ